MKASPHYTLSGWEVRLDIPGRTPEWLSPTEARELAQALLGAAYDADRSATSDAAKELKELVFARLSCAPYHVAGGLAKLLDAPLAVVEAALVELQQEGRVSLYRGMDGFYQVSSAGPNDPSRGPHVP